MFGLGDLLTLGESKLTRLRRQIQTDLHEKLTQRAKGKYNCYSKLCKFQVVGFTFKSIIIHFGY